MLPYFMTSCLYLPDDIDLWSAGMNAMFVASKYSQYYFMQVYNMRKVLLIAVPEYLSDNFEAVCKNLALVWIDNCVFVILNTGEC